MAWLFGIDSSFDELTADEAAALKAAGVQVYFQCLWTGTQQPASRVVSLRNAQHAGLILGGYISITREGSGADHVERGSAGIPSDLWAQLVKVPVDVELPGIRPERVDEALEALAFLGKPKDVYTSFNAWVNYVGNAPRPAGVGLWNAYWDGATDFDYPSLRFGNWQDHEVWGEQFSGGTHVAGQYCDLNVFRSEAFAPAPPPPPTPPAPESVHASVVVDGRVYTGELMRTSQ